MLFKLLCILGILGIAILIYIKYRNNERSMANILSIGLITGIVCAFFIPSNISVFDIAMQVKTFIIKDKTTISENDLNYIPDTDSSENSENTIDNEGESIINEETSTDENSLNGDLDVQAITSVEKDIAAIESNSMDISPIKLKYVKGEITKDEQIDEYEFIPPINGRYRFEMSKMLSGVKVTMKIYNQAEELIDSTYQIENSDGLTIDGMIANEKYYIDIIQDSSYSKYKLLIGYQKEIVTIGDKITNINDSIQYTDQENIYKFIPPLDGRYRFEIAGMISGAKIRLYVYNSGGEAEDYTYEIVNNDGLTIDDMIAGETYTIYIDQHTGVTDYNLLIGYQKKTVKIADETDIFDSIQYTGQKNQYIFSPPIDGRYRFELSNLISGVKVNMNVLNQAGESVDNTSYGIQNGDGLTIDDMVAGETYTVQIVQYNEYSNYRLLVGRQKQMVDISNINSISDSVQYTEQMNIYNFQPKSNGSYSFTIDNLVSGMKINISIYNEGGECIDQTSYGIENRDYLLIENMINGENYSIHITQCEGTGSYIMYIDSVKDENQ